MQSVDFTADAPGKVLRHRHGYWFFVPAPLEPRLDLELPLVNALSRADRALSELAGITRSLPDTRLLVRVFMRREAVLSSRIEGTQASLSDLLWFEAAGPKAGMPAGDVQEVANYMTALDYALKRLDELPVSLRLIREMHERLMQGVRGEAQTPGRFRRSQNWIGPAGCTLSDAIYVPPPVEEMKIALDAFEKYLHRESPLPPLIRLALIHYQFEAIHPFLDGNGRIGRLLISLLLRTEGLLTDPALYLSAYFERHRQQYHRYLLEVSTAGRWPAWIRFFLEAVETQAKDAIVRTDELLSLWQHWRQRLQVTRTSALSLKLVDELFLHPMMNARMVRERLGVTPRAAQMNIDRLIDAGILEEITGRRRNRIYAAHEIISILERESGVRVGEEVPRSRGHTIYSGR